MNWNLWTATMTRQVYMRLNVMTTFLKSLLTGDMPKFNLLRWDFVHKIQYDYNSSVSSWPMSLDRRILTFNTFNIVSSSSVFPQWGVQGTEQDSGLVPPLARDLQSPCGPHQPWGRMDLHWVKECATQHRVGSWRFGRHYQYPLQ